MGEPAPAQAVSVPSKEKAMRKMNANERLLFEDIERTQVMPSLVASSSEREADDEVSGNPAKRQKATGVVLASARGPPSKRRRKSVLDEEVYLEEMGRIIARDYFPLVSSSKSDDALAMSLDEFGARYTSEDNASFEKLLDKSHQEHVRRYWWSYDGDSLTAAGVASPDPSAPGLYVLPDGSRITAERRQFADGISSGPLEDRRASLEYASHEPRSALFFAPQTRSGDDDALVIRSANPRCRPKPARRALVQSANTRFLEPLPEDEELDAASLGAPSSAELVTKFSGDNPELARLVPMTPEPDPHAHSPLVTWGSLAAPPRTISEARDELARALDAKAKRRRPTPSPLRAVLDAAKRRERRQQSDRTRYRDRSLTPRPSPRTTTPLSSRRSASTVCRPADTTPLPSPLVRPS